MATSGTFTKSHGSYLHLDLLWSRIETDVAGNRSKIRLTLQLRQTGTGLSYSANKTGTLHGVSFTHTSGFQGPGTKTIHTRDVWISHNSDGTKSQSFSATYNIAITYSGSWLASMSVSGVADITAIPRASSLNSFSFGSSLKPSTSNTISLSISRPSTSFTHDIELRDGTTVIRSWTGQGLPTSLALTSTNVNTILSRMSTVTSKSLTLRVQTKSGSTNVGSAVTRNATATVDSSVLPTVTTPTVSIYGSGRDKTLGMYIRNITRVTASCTPSATGGATVASTKIVVKRSTGLNAQTINGSSGTTAKAIAYSGSYVVIATVTDSRGRSVDSNSATFTSEAYTPPKITTFKAVRSSSTQTTVIIDRTITWSSLSGSNPLTEKIDRRLGVGGSWTNIRNVSSTTGSISGTRSYTGHLVTNSYEFRLTVTDSFGNSVTSEARLSTQKTVMDIYRDVGVGIGKLWERGTLDVGGPIYMNDQLLTSLFASTSHNHSASDINSGTLSYLRIPRGTTSTTVATGNHKHSEYEVEVGSNTSGRWAKFPNGVMICTANVSTSSSNFVELNATVSGDIKRSRLATVSMPQSFSTVWYVNFGVLGGTATSIRGNILGTKLQYGSSTQTPLTSSWSAPAFFHTSTISTSTTAGFVFFAIGSY